MVTDLVDLEPWSAWTGAVAKIALSSKWTPIVCCPGRCLDGRRTGLSDSKTPPSVR